MDDSDLNSEKKIKPRSNQVVSWQEKWNLLRDSNIFTATKWLSAISALFLVFSINWNSFYSEFSNPMGDVLVTKASKGLRWRASNSFSWKNWKKKKHLPFPIELENAGSDDVLFEVEGIKLILPKGSATKVYKKGPNIISEVQSGTVYSEGNEEYLQIIDHENNRPWSSPLEKSKPVTFNVLSPKDGVEQTWVKQLLPYQRFFQKCYIKYYKEHQGKVEGGSLIFDLNINKKGRIAKAGFDQNDFIEDKKFSDCLIAVAKRIQVRPTGRASTQLKFPINFSLPDQR